MTDGILDAVSIETLASPHLRDEVRRRCKAELERRRRRRERAGDVDGAIDEISASLPSYPLDIWAPIPPEDGEPSPQEVAFDSPADETFYGGGAGGGKTDLQLGLALTAHRKSIIFRREQTQVQGLEDRLLEILRTDRGYNKNARRFVGRVGDVTRLVRLGGMQRVRDWSKYQGQPYDLICFDELPHFVREQLRNMVGWNRTNVVSQRSRVVCGGNPPTNPDQEWVIDEWAPWLDPDFDGNGGPAEPGELRWYRYVEGATEGHDIEWYTRDDLEADEHGDLYVLEDIDGSGVRPFYPRSRTFVPALVDDNPHYLATGYDRQLDAMPEPLRSLLRDGKFEVSSSDDRWQVIPSAWVEAAFDRWKALHSDDEGNPVEFEPDVPLTALGVDPSRGGKDVFAIAKRYGNYFAEIEAHPGASVPDGQTGAALVIEAGASEQAPAIVDTIGVGSSTYDALPWGVAVSFVASEKSTAETRNGLYPFKNRRAEMWWGMREALDPETGDDLALPPNRVLKAEMCAPRYKVTVQGIQIEEKEDVKKRIGRSTNLADAVCQARLDDGLPAVVVV